jgi:trans-2,3-dihydro-3-hydroxyanthranilate isomerase
VAARELLFVQVDVFTERVFGGNPLAVVFEGAGLSDAEMQAIAREMNVSETVFVLPATDPEADLQIRWFTPTTEVALCGHATIACFHALAEEGRLGAGLEARTFQVQTRSGTLPVRVEPGDGGAIRVWFGLPRPELRPCRLDREVLAELLGTRPARFDAQLPFAEFYSYVVVPIRSLAALQALSPDPHGLARLSRTTGVWGYCAVTLETIDADSKVHIRFFAPSEGILEDPVTGSAHGPLGLFLWRNGVVAPVDGVISYVGEQGDGLGRPGRVHVRLQTAAADLECVEVGGAAVTVLAGVLHLPD